MKRIKKLLGASGGFTLIELIIVIAVMGFLVAMIVPRLAMITEGASDTACDTNQTRLRQVVANLQEATGQLPNYLTNLVTVVGTTYYKPCVDDNDKDTGKEALSRDMDQYMHLCLHTLSAEEAEEIKDLGIMKVFNLNLSKDVDPDFAGPDSDQPYMQLIDVAEGVGVMMIGAGDMVDGTDGWSQNDTVWYNTYDEFGTPPDLIYRIAFGVGKDSSLVKDGQLQHAALCPNGMRRADHFIYNNYNIVLPRLKSTVDELSTVANVYKTITAEADIGERKTFNVLEAQEIWQFTTFCPEGCQPATAGIAETWTFIDGTTL